jgi:hypothetical protein
MPAIGIFTGITKNFIRLIVSGGGPSGDALLLADGSSYLLLADGSSFLLLA